MRERLLTVPIVARRLDVSEETVRKMCRTGELSAGKVGGQWKIREADFGAYYRRVFGPGGPYDPPVEYRR